MTDIRTSVRWTGILQGFGDHGERKHGVLRAVGSCWEFEPGVS